jgi:beta-N-acetylhexosaminidase
LTTPSPLVLDIAGLSLNDDDRRRLRHPLTGGLVLFSRNWQDRRQLTELAAEVKSVRPDILITVDHEGGRVQRFRSDGFTHLPPMGALGRLWMKDAMRAVGTASACGYVLGAELRACGVDMSFTPVLDLDHGRSGVIGDRAFHRDPRVVAVLAQSVVVGLLRAGMNNCGKHFPGHGHALADSHTGLAVDERSLTAILADDARPYGWLATALTCVMPAHVTFPKVDKRPAGFSSRWLKDVLRGRLGFTGAICCDDLSMEGARVAGTPVDGGIAALNAGCDLLLFCNQSLVDGGKPLDALLDGLQAGLEQGRWQPDPLSESRRLELLPRTAPLPWDELMHQPTYQAARERLP